MNSRKNAILPLISPLALSFVLSGCLAGENKTFFDYRIDDTESADGTQNGSASAAIPGSNSNQNLNQGTNNSSLCCNIETALLVPASQTGCDRSIALVPSVSIEECKNLTFQNGIQSTRFTERFSISNNTVKKIDFLFVVDNSGSMADNQAKLAAGFETFANSFFRRDDLDICISIITSDRYLGRNNGSNYARERTVPCTNPGAWSSLSPALKNAYIDQIIREFKTKVNVGTRGSGTELIGKSLVTYLHDLDQWNENQLNQGVTRRFFRTDSVVNISILTDENNWFYRDPQRDEFRNDLPVTRNAPIYNSPISMIDPRKGIKEYLDEYFAAIQPTHPLTYSVSSFLETSKGPDTIPGLAKNLDLLGSMTGRESAKTDIEGNTRSFTDLYQSIATNLVNRASAFHLSHAIIEPQLPQSIQDLSVVLVRADQSRIQLVYGTDFTVLMPDGVVLNQSILDTCQPGDSLEIEYRHLIQN